MALRTAGCLVTLMMVVMVVVVVREGAEGLPGTYKSFSDLNGKYIPAVNAINTTKASFENCTMLCVKHKTCNAFAYSRMEGICMLYAKGRGQNPVKLDGFNLFVRLRDEADGFYVIGSSYIKMVLQRKTYREAEKFCDRNYYGNLPYVTNPQMNLFLENMLRRSVVFAATIGITDQKEEGKWVYGNTGEKITYSNWHWKGVWRLTDRNCVTITIDGSWVMSDCWQPQYFFCQMPLY